MSRPRKSSSVAASRLPAALVGLAVLPLGLALCGCESADEGEVTTLQYDPDSRDVQASEAFDKRMGGG